MTRDGIEAKAQPPNPRMQPTSASNRTAAHRHQPVLVMEPRFSAGRASRLQLMRQSLGGQPPALVDIGLEGTSGGCGRSLDLPEEYLPPR